MLVGRTGSLRGMLHFAAWDRRSACEPCPESTTTCSTVFPRGLQCAAVGIRARCITSHVGPRYRRGPWKVWPTVGPTTILLIEPKKRK